MSDSSFSSFPYGKLTKIIGKPSNTSLQVLKRQLYDNAASVSSRRGGGAHGHLGMILDTPQYLAISNNIPWVTPTHPGDAPNLVLATTAVQREQITRLFDSDLVAFELYSRTSNALKQQLLLSVNSSFLRALEDPTFGFMATTPLAMIQHLDSTYGTLTPEELEVNRLELSKPWNPESPIEELWASVDNILRLARNGYADISEVTAITILLAMFETSGLLGSTTEKFRLKDTSEWTLTAFKADINRGNKERLRKLTTGTSGYHGAHAAIPRSATPCPPTPDANCEGINLYYCWSHGLSTYANHTSSTCINKKAGHVPTATLRNQQSGAYFRIPTTQQTGPPTMRSARRAIAALTVSEESPTDL